MGVLCLVLFSFVRVITNNDYFLKLQVRQTNVGLDPASTVYRKIRNIRHTQNIFEILATPKKYSHSVLWPVENALKGIEMTSKIVQFRNDPNKCIEMTSKIVQFRNDPNKCIEMTSNIVQFRDDPNKCIEMTSKIVQFPDDPKKYLLFFQTTKIFMFLKTPKILKFKSLNPKKWTKPTSEYLSLPPPPPLDQAEHFIWCV